MRILVVILAYLFIAVPASMISGLITAAGLYLYARLVGKNLSTPELGVFVLGWIMGSRWLWKFMCFEIFELPKPQQLGGKTTRS